MNITIEIKATELAEAINRLADAIAGKTAPVEAPAEAPAVTPEPEKPKRTRKAKQPEPEAPAESTQESTQESTGEPEAPQAATTPTEPEKPTESPQEPADVTLTREAIANAGAALLDRDPNVMTDLLNLLSDYGVQSIMHLGDGQLSGFADRLRALGAEV